MKRYRLTISILLLALVTMVQAQDMQRLSERDIQGTARYVGMAGAMTAIGGDASAAMDNPAGIGVYQHLETQLTLDLQLDRTTTELSNVGGISRNYFIPSSASVVFALPASGRTSLLNHNLMFGYRRLRTYNRELLMDSPVDYYSSLESGYMGQYSMGWGMNLGYKLYLGVALNIQSWSFSKENVQEVPVEGYVEKYLNRNIFSGVGVNGNFGIIYRPVELLRLGFSIQTPTGGRTRYSDYGYLDVFQGTHRIDSLGYENSTASYNAQMYLPFRMAAGVALQFSRYGMLSLEYNLQTRPFMMPMHTLKVGVEFIAFRHLYINAGYAYDSPFASAKPDRYGEGNRDYRTDVDFRNTIRSHYASAAIGYQGRSVHARMAYQWRLQNLEVYPDMITTVPYIVDATTHRLVWTLAWTH